MDKKSLEDMSEDIRPATELQFVWQPTGRDIECPECGLGG